MTNSLYNVPTDNDRISAGGILISDRMCKQIEGDRSNYERIIQKLKRAAHAESYGTLAEFLRKKNGKSMRGCSFPVWKWQSNKGDRILYTYGKYMSEIRQEDGGTIVLICYSNHDMQDRFAKSFTGKGKASRLKDYSEEAGDDDDEISSAEKQMVELVFSGDFCRSHRLFRVDDKTLEEMNFSESDVYLSDEQSDCVDLFISRREPMLVRGCAGTGKTLVALHAINDFNMEDPEKKAAYFTQSYELRKSVEKRYKRINTSAGNVIFEDVNEYALKTLGRPVSHMAKVVTQETFLSRFPEWIAQRSRGALAKQQGSIDWLSVWTEIRGIIKGQLDWDWNRYQGVMRGEIGDSAFVNQLIDDHWLAECPADRRLLKPCDSPSELIKRVKREALDEKLTARLNKIISRFDGVDPNCIDIGMEAYCSELTGEDSTVPTDKRALYWEIYQQYAKWLKENDYQDENDLAREALAALKASENAGKYDLIAIDEVQDYTEMQLAFLYALSADGRNILLAGDENQNVNPTLFRADHLSVLFARRGIDLRRTTLNRDYRCPRNIVHMENRLAEVRKTRIARQHNEQETRPEGIREAQAAPYRLLYSEENLVNMLRTLAETPWAVVLVPDGVTKDFVMSCAERNGLDDLPPLHTVPEIKGMEYRYVFCYDIIGRYGLQWDSIMSEKHERMQTGERFYFNMLNVAMTRSQKILGFMDQMVDPRLEEVLQLFNTSSFNKDLLHLGAAAVKAEDWLAFARASEGAGNYEDAKRMYSKGGFFQYLRRCDAKIARKEQRYEDFFRFALASEDDDLIEESMDYLPEGSYLQPLAKAMVDESQCRFSQLKSGGENAASYLDRVCEGFSAEEREKAATRITELLTNTTDYQLKKMEDFFNAGK